MILSGLSLIASIAALPAPRPAPGRDPLVHVVLHLLGRLTFVFIAVGAVLDGGVRSPISYFLILPMLFAGLAYSAGMVTFLAGFGVLTTLVVGFLTPDRSWSTTAFLAVGIVIAGVITAAAAANRDRLMRQLMAAASLDALTGASAVAPSRSASYHQSLLAERHYATFSVIVADLDNLKTLNDANGHHCGDRALKLLAGVLRQAARETDVVGRLGGDEFALLLHETDQDAATGHRPPGYSARCTTSTGSDWVTASIGVSTWLGPNDAPDDAVAAGRRGPLRGQAFRSQPRRGLGAARH